MRLEIREEYKTDWLSQYYVGWSQQDFKNLLCLTKRARVKKDGTFYKRDKELIHARAVNYYRDLWRRFEFDKAIFEDEQATVLRLLNTLPAEQFRSFAEATFEPYINLETDTTTVDDG